METEFCLYTISTSNKLRTNTQKSIKQKMLVRLNPKIVIQNVSQCLIVGYKLSMWCISKSYPTF